MSVRTSRQDKINDEEIHGAIQQHQHDLTATSLNKFSQRLVEVW